MNRKKQKWRAVILTLLAVVVIPLGAVFAYLSATKQEGNIFSPGLETKPVFTDNVDENIIRDVKVNVGNPGYPVYVRVAIIATWRSEEGNVHWQKPTSDNYDMHIDETNWFYNAQDGFYYLKNMQLSGETHSLITLYYQTGSAPADGYSLHIELAAQTIQALGTTDDGDTPAVTSTWNIQVSNGLLVDPNP